MGIRKNIVVDGMEVPFKASATVPRLYRMKFGRDIFKDFSNLQKSVKSENEDNSEIENLKTYEISYINFMFNANNSLDFSYILCYTIIQTTTLIFPRICGGDPDMFTEKENDDFFSLRKQGLRCCLYIY